MAFPPRVPPRKSAAPADDADTKKPAAKKPAAKKAPTMTAEQKADLVSFPAPDGMKGSFYEVCFKTNKDGYLDAEMPVTVTRIVGRIDSDKRYDWMQVDSATSIAIVSRLSASIAASNPLRRLSPNKTFRVTLRAAPTSAGMISTGIKLVERGRMSTKKPGAVIWGTPLERPAKGDTTPIDPDLRLLRRSARTLRGAFTATAPIPAKSRRKVKDTDE